LRAGLPFTATVVFAIAMSGSAAAAPAASSARKPPPVSYTCHSAQQCAIRVLVECASSPCRMSVPGQENVSANGFDVVWEIVQSPGQSYLFRNPGGIRFKSAEGRKAFRCHAEMRGARYSCHGNRNGRSYEYQIELVGTPPVSVLDPWIVNR
jgi:hypothetical protein